LVQLLYRQEFDMPHWVAAPASSPDSMWSKVVIPLLLIVVCIPSNVEAQNFTNFFFPTFTSQDVAHLLQDGDTAYNQDNSSYELNVGGVSGLGGYSCSRLVYKDTVWMLDKASGTVASFSTSFTFSFTSKNLSSSTCGDGLVFTFGAATNITAAEYTLEGPEFCLIDFETQVNSSYKGVFAVVSTPTKMVRHSMI
jgi:hypothetical protein